jgi:hypothetical protein
VAGSVDTIQLNAYLQSRVRELAKEIGQEQDSQFFKGRDAEVYLLAAFKMSRHDCQSG